jgi:hypothetical protein
VPISSQTLVFSKTSFQFRKITPKAPRALYFIAALELPVEPAPSPALIDTYRDSADRLRALYLAHIRAEDEILTALAKRSLDQAELSQISQEMRERRAVASRDPHA